MSFLPIQSCHPNDATLRDRWFGPLGVAIAIVLLAGCGAADRDQGGNGSSLDGGADAKRAVSVHLNWFPEPEHGGLYQASAGQIYEAAGLDVEIRPGAEGTTVGAELELGRCLFAMANADDVALMREQGTDIVAVMAVMQNSPRCILVREDSGVKKFTDLAGKKLQRSAGRPFLEFMRSQGLLDQVSEVPYHGSVASLIGDPDIAIQAYSYSEPLLAQQQGVEVRTLMLSDLGWNPYSSVLVTTGRLIRDDPELVRSFVATTKRGWQSYLADPTKGNAAIQAANKHGMTPEALAFGSRELRPLALPDGMPPESVGTMTLARWQTLISQMAGLKLVDADKVRPEDCFTTQFLD